MYSIKFAAKLVNIKELRNRIVEKLSIFIVLSTYYLTFRLIWYHFALIFACNSTIMFYRRV